MGNIPIISLHQGIEFIPVTLLRILLYLYFINYVFLWLRGVHEVIEWLTLKYANLLAW